MGCCPPPALGTTRGRGGHRPNWCVTRVCSTCDTHANILHACSHMCVQASGTRVAGACLHTLVSRSHALASCLCTLAPCTLMDTCVHAWVMLTHACIMLVRACTMHTHAHACVMLAHACVCLHRAHSCSHMYTPVSHSHTRLHHACACLHCTCVCVPPAPHGALGLPSSRLPHAATRVVASHACLQPRGRPTRWSPRVCVACAAEDEAPEGAWPTGGFAGKAGNHGRVLGAGLGAGCWVLGWVLGAELGARPGTPCHRRATRCPTAPPSAKPSSGPPGRPHPMP